MVSGVLDDPYLTQGNTLLRMLQTLVQPNVINVGVTTPPGSPANGDTYIVGSGASGLWSGQGTSIAYWSTDNSAAPSGEWEFYSPKVGWVVGNQTNGTLYIFYGGVWVAAGNSPESIQFISSSVTLGFSGGFNTLVQATAGGGGINLVLPTAIGVKGQIIRIMMVDTGVGGVNIGTSLGQTINGFSSYGLTNQYQTVSLESNNANWLIIAVVI
jgi:hypothetical protein